VTERGEARDGFLLTAGILCAGLVASIVAQVVPAARGTALHLAWPQAWSFFAYPEHKRLTAFDAGDLHLLHVPETSGETLWGLRRLAFRRDFELASLSAQIPDSAWLSCASPDVATCRTGTRVALRNPVLHPAVCGDVLLAWERAELGASVDASADPWQIESVVAAHVACSA